MKYKLIALNESGQRIGETHPRARLTDADVDMIRELHEEHRLGYKTIADKFDVSKSLIRYICKYERRAQTPASYKRVDCPQEPAVSDRVREMVGKPPRPPATLHGHCWHLTEHVAPDARVHATSREERQHPVDPEELKLVLGKLVSLVDSPARDAMAHPLVPALSTPAKTLAGLIGMKPFTVRRVLEYATRLKLTDELYFNPQPKRYRITDKGREYLAQSGE